MQRTVSVKKKYSMPQMAHSTRLHGTLNGAGVHPQRVCQRRRRRPPHFLVGARQVADHASHVAALWCKRLTNHRNLMDEPTLPCCCAWIPCHSNRNKMKKQENSDAICACCPTQTCSAAAARYSCTIIKRYYALLQQYSSISAGKTIAVSAAPAACSAPAARCWPPPRRWPPWRRGRR